MLSFISIPFLGFFLAPLHSLSVPSPLHLIFFDRPKQTHTQKEKPKMRCRFRSNTIFCFDLTTWSGIICMYLNVSFIANYECTVCFPCFLASHPYGTLHSFFVSVLFSSALEHQCKYGHRNPNADRIIKQNRNEKSLTFHERCKWEEQANIAFKGKQENKKIISPNRNKCHYACRKHSLFSLCVREATTRKILSILHELREFWHHRHSICMQHAACEM